MRIFSPTQPEKESSKCLFAKWETCSPFEQLKWCNNSQEMHTAASHKPLSRHQILPDCKDQTTSHFFSDSQQQTHTLVLCFR